MLSALTSVELAIGEVNDAASMLGQKLPAELDAMLQSVYAATLAEHVDGADTRETAKLVETLKATIDDYVNSQLEAKREGIYATLAPVSEAVHLKGGWKRRRAAGVFLFPLLMSGEQTQEHIY